MNSIGIKEYDIYNPGINTEVTEHYVKIIAVALEKNGLVTNKIAEIKKSKENNKKGIIVITPGAVQKAKKAKYKNIIFWSQGIIPEESLMRHKKSLDRYLRYLYLSISEMIALKRADFVVLVSEAMQKYYLKKYRVKLKNYYIMPCFNEEISRDIFYTEGKYTQDNIFTYAGSIEPWQCFESTVKVFADIEKSVANAHLRVLVKQRDEAERIIRQYGIKNYSIDFVPKEQVSVELAKAKFGFCLRQESPINRVATPTKLSSYVCTGVMPIYSSVLEDFHKRAQGSDYCFCVDVNSDKQDIGKVIKVCKENISAEDVLNSFRVHFGNYYSSAYHVDRLKDRIKCIL